MKYIGIGMLLSLVGIVVAIAIWDIHMVADITGMIGLIFLAISMLLSGALINGDRMRLNAATETDDARKQRNQVMMCSLLIALPNFLVMLVFYFWLR